MASALEAGFRGPQVCKIVGISYRQLDYWARTDLVTPSVQDARGSGSQRLYSFEDLIDLKLVKKLLDAGISLQRVREAISYLHELGHDPTGITIASDGNTVYACKSPEEVFDLLRKGQGVFGIALDPVLAELKGSVSELQMAQEQERTEEPAPGPVQITRKAQGED